MADKSILSEEDLKKSSEALDLSGLFEAAGDNDSSEGIDEKNIENIKNIIAALKDEKFQQDYSFATEDVADLVRGLEEVVAQEKMINKTSLEGIKATFTKYQEGMKWEVRACLAHYLREKGTSYVPVVKKEETLGGVENRRIRSLNSDANETKLNAIRSEILNDMGIETNGESPLVVAEDRLNDKEKKDFDERLAMKVAEDQELLQSASPLVLASSYATLKELLSKKGNEDNTEYKQAYEKVTKQVDDVIAQYAHGEGYFYADVTNATDVYVGYEALFDARYEDAEQKVKDDIEKGREKNKNHMEGWDDKNGDHKEGYDEYLNLENLTEKDAGRLDTRFDELSAQVASLEVDDDTLKLIKNIHFEGDEDQFDDEGKIKPDSKLAEMVEIARTNLVMEHLADNDEPESIENEELGDSLTTCLFAAHTETLVQQGVWEDINQYTDPKYLEEFKKKLQNADENMTISDFALEKTKDDAVNQVCGFAYHLNDKLNGGKKGKDKEAKPVAIKMMNMVSNFDKHKDERLKPIKAKKKQRIENLKRILKGGVLAVGMSAAITTVGTMAASDATLTAMTGGLNKFAGMALGVGLGVGMTIHTVRKWKRQKKNERPDGGMLTNKQLYSVNKAEYKKQLAEYKQRKANGEQVEKPKKPVRPWGLKAMVKDPNLMTTVATTALGSAALGFAATGNMGVAQALGYGALALGGGKVAVQTTIDSKKNGLSMLESLGWGLGTAAAVVGGGFLGRELATSAINSYNQHHPDNKIFQHEETRTTTREVEREIDVYKEDYEAHAKDVCGRWYKGNEELLQQRVDAINQYNAEHGTDIHPYRYLMEMHDSGAIAPTDTINHVDGGGSVHTNGQHTIITKQVAEGLGVDSQSLKAFANSFGSDGSFNPTDDALKAFNTIDNHTNYGNQVHYEGTNAARHHDGVLTRNAAQNPDGSMNTTIGTEDKADVYASLVKHGDSPWVKETIIDTIEDTTQVLVPNDIQGGMATLGMLGNKIRKVGLRDRLGALADKVLPWRKKKVVETKDVYAPTPIPDPRPGPEPTPPTPILDPKLLLDEYRIVYGGVLCKQDKSGKVELDEQGKPIFINEKCEKRFNEYYDMVEKERQAEGFSGNMNEYLQERFKRLDAMIEHKCGEVESTPVAKLYQEKDKSHVVYDTDAAKLDDNDNRAVRIKADYMAHAKNGARASAAIVANTRQTWMESNLSHEYRDKLTLTHFTGYMEHVIVKDELVADGSRSPDLNIMFKDNPKSITVVDTDTVMFGSEVTGRKEFQQRVEFKSDDNVLKKELAVRKSLDELHGVDSNPKTNDLVSRIKKLDERHSSKAGLGKDRTRKVMTIREGDSRSSR